MGNPLGDIFGLGIDVMASQQQSDAELKQGQAGYYKGKQNAELYKQLAADAQFRGAQQAGLAVSKGSKVIGAERAGYAASGVDPSSPTAMQVMTDARLMSSVDAQTIRANAAREAWGYTTKSQMADEQAGLDLQTGLDRSNATVLTGLGTAAGLSGDFVSSAYGYKGGQ